jgi:hypothetical protein
MAMKGQAMKSTLTGISLAALGAAAFAQTTGAAQPIASPAPGPTSNYVTIVKVPKPWYAPQFLVKNKMQETVPQYERIAGLAFKAYSFAQADGQFGGIYLWADRASAEQWFSPAWFERVQRERGVSGEVRYFESLLVLDNTAKAPQLLKSEQAVAVLASITPGAPVSRERLIAQFKASAAQDQQAAGLLRKYYVSLPSGGFGEVSLWASQAQAQQAYGAAWQSSMQKTYGGTISMEWFDAPILLRNTIADNALLKAHS